MIGRNVAIYVAVTPVDMRKSFDGLAAAAEPERTVALLTRFEEHYCYNPRPPHHQERGEQSPVPAGAPKVWPFSAQCSCRDGAYPHMHAARPGVSRGFVEQPQGHAEQRDG